ncbi:hypothetical protein XENOCAPTIV_005760 [Xenoophorus captivus]|uniref:Uncharacterized protein n=1 Tax=Xenoophorus captivus TaxID=1517983 RepID=A0ABV0RVE0_9TELE
MESDEHLLLILITGGVILLHFMVDKGFDGGQEFSRQIQQINRAQNLDKYPCLISDNRCPSPSFFPPRCLQCPSTCREKQGMTPLYEQTVTLDTSAKALAGIVQK